MDRKELETLLTADEIAQLCRTSLSTVYAWMQSGALPCVRLGPRCVRIEPDDFENFRKAARIVGNSRGPQS